MERFEDILAAEVIGATGIVVEDAVDLQESEFSEQESAKESISTDDPVRVYLREMGAVRLLSRQGEITLAMRMERGKLLMHKALSRSPLVWLRTLDFYEAFRRDKSSADQFIEFASMDDDVRAQMRTDVGRRLTKFARVYQRLTEVEAKLAATPQRHTNLRAKLAGEILRWRVRCSQEVRQLPFRAEQWKRFRTDLEKAAQEKRHDRVTASQMH